MFHCKKTFDFEYDVKEADICLLGIPFDSTEIGKSCKYGPLFIRQAMRELIGLDPKTGRNVFVAGKFTDLGDLDIVPGSWLKTEQKIIETINDVFAENPRIVPAFLGGEHLITLGILKALVDKHGKLTIVDFDAHRDLRSDWLGEKYSHLTWLRRAIEELGDRLDVVQLGQRQWDEQEDAFLKESNIKDSVIDVANSVYVTVDLDIFNTVDVGTPEAGGISWSQFLSFVEELRGKKIVGFDIVESSASVVGSESAVLAANVFKELAGLVI